MFDLVITGGEVVWPDRTASVDIAVRDGRIAALGVPGSLAGARTIDAHGCWVLPGLIDGHVHLAQPLGEFHTCDDFFSGTVAAAFGGTTTVVDFAIPERGELPLAALERRRAQAEGKAVIDYGFHACCTRATREVLDQIPMLVEAGAPTVKMFTVYRDLVMIPMGEIRAVLRELRGCGGLAAFHAEQAEIIEYEVARHVAMGRTGPADHAHSRPREAEAAAVAALVAVLRATGAAGYFVHLSSAAARPILDQARAEGLAVYGETCPHYLLMDESVYERDDGCRFICSPPIRGEADRAALWEMLAAGSIQMINTDHCCYDSRQKERHRGDFTRAPNGLPGVETRLPALLAAARGRLSLSRLVALLSSNAARLLGLYPRKGTIAPGSDADLVIVDPRCAAPLPDGGMHMASDYTPLAGLPGGGLPAYTISRGRIVVERGALKGAAGHGQYLHRRIAEEVVAGPAV